MRIAVAKDAWSGLPLDPDITRAVAATATLLGEMGHAVVQASPEFDYPAFLAAQIDLWCGHTAAAIDSIAAAVGRVPSNQNLQSTSWAVYEAGRLLPATRLVAAEEHYNIVTQTDRPLPVWF